MAYGSGDVIRELQDDLGEATRTIKYVFHTIIRKGSLLSETELDILGAVTKTLYKLKINPYD